MVFLKYPSTSSCHLKACVKVCVRELAKRDSSFADTLKKKTYAKLGRDHPDLRAVRPCPVPLVIVGNKYDIFKVSIVYSRPTSDDGLVFPCPPAE